jgi:hypothetical protein
VVEVLGPVLGVDDGAGEAVAAGELGQVAPVVAVVAGAREQEPAGELDPLLLAISDGVLGGDVPAGLVGRPVGGHDAVAEADLLVDPLLGRRVLDVLPDRLAVGDDLVAVPRPERVAEGEHVRVGPDAGEAEQVPRPADGVAGLEDGPTRPRELGPHVVRGTDARQPRPHDQHVEVLGLFGVHHRKATAGSFRPPSPLDVTLRAKATVG